MKTNVVLLCLIAVALSMTVSKSRESKVTSPEPWQVIDQNDIPDSWFWGNVDGKNYLGTPRQQHQPKYCGSCWAHCTTGSLGDRFNIARMGQYPLVVLSPQYILNNMGTCILGDPNEVHLLAIKTGLVDETCQIYQARDDILSDNPLRTCYQCELPNNCYPVTQFPRYFAKEHGLMTSLDPGVPPMEQRMKAEIYARGPIACEIATPATFEHWNETGVYTDLTNSTLFSHCISVVGWGTEGGVPFWWVRNSWGQFWGDQGMIKVHRGINNIGIESLCWWATPDMERSGLKQAPAPRRLTALKNDAHDQYGGH